MQRILISLLTFCCIISCGQNESNATTAKATTQATTPSQQDTFIQPVVRGQSEEVYNSACAIIVTPTQQTIDSLKKAYSEQEYAALAEDNIHYLTAAKTLFKTKKLTMVDKLSIGQVKFKKADGTTTEMEISEFFWGVILFNGKSDPIEADITTIDEEYDRYMQ